jgi:hypothetical protein
MQAKPFQDREIPDMAMRRSTAIRHLVEMADAASGLVAGGPGPFRVPLVEMWVAGELLEAAAELDQGDVILTFALPPEELPWLSLHPATDWIAREMRLGRRPMAWVDRPAAWPAWNCRYDRVVRFWTARDGLDEAVTEALRDGGPLDVIAPGPEAFVAQCRHELAMAKAHLRSIIEQYWDDDWRRANRHVTSPEDHLWRAAQAFLELDAAIDHAP